MVADQAGRIRVVGRNGGLPVEDVVGDDARAPQLIEPFPHAFRELGSGFPGEGEAEDLFGAYVPLATSHTTRAAIVSLFPEPAPATTRPGRKGAAMTAACSGVGSGSPSRRASCAGP